MTLKCFFKKFGYIIAILVIAVVAAINMNLDSNSYDLSDWQLANIEALSRDESPGGLCENEKYCDEEHGEICYILMFRIS